MYQGKHVNKKQDYAQGRPQAELRSGGSGYEDIAAPAAAAVKAPRKKKKKLRGWKKAIVILCAVLAVFASLYCVFVFSNNPFIKKWRTIYIETAMSTMTHQWLATSFIPHSIIEEVQKNTASVNQDQQDLSSKWWGSTDDEATKTASEKDAFYKKFWELDQDKFEEYLAGHPDVLKNGYSGIVIDNLSCSDKTLTTSFGEVIRALNVPDNVILMQVTGGDYVGTLACLKNPDQFSLVKANSYGSYGELIEDYCKDNVLAINASGFQDYNGVGNGGVIVGSFVLNGKEYGEPTGGYLYYGFKTDQRLYITSSIADNSQYKWVVQFAPALDVNGESKVAGSYGWGVQPRSSIGQTKDGEMLMLIVDGRQVGYSLGCTVSDCADIMVRHKAYQAANLDGGSSSIMAYEGSIITKNSSKSSNGRTLPNAFVVAHPN